MGGQPITESIEFHLTLIPILLQLMDMLASEIKTAVERGVFHDSICH